MIKKVLFLLVMFISIAACSQSRYTADQVEKSSDPKVVANFIKYNPNHPKTPAFKQKLYAMLNGGNTSVAKPEVKPINTQKLKARVENDVKKGTSDAKTQKTVDLLNHLFSNDPNRKEAYVNIQNRSKCNLIVKISGKKFYNLDVKANDQNFILVDKGTYTLTTSICDAKYSSVKNLNKDMSIILNAK